MLLRDHIISNLATHLDKLDRGLKKGASDSACLANKISMVRINVFRKLVIDYKSDFSSYAMGNPTAPHR